MSVLHTFSMMDLVSGVSGLYRICPISMGLRKAQAMAPPVVLTISRYMFMQKGAAERKETSLSAEVEEMSGLKRVASK